MEPAPSHDNHRDLADFLEIDPVVDAVVLSDLHTGTVLQAQTRLPQPQEVFDHIADATFAALETLMSDASITDETRQVTAALSFDWGELIICCKAEVGEAVSICLRPGDSVEHLAKTAESTFDRFAASGTDG